MRGTLLGVIARRGRFVARRRLGAAADHSKRRLLARAADRLDRIEISAVAGNDTIELGQRLDLIHDDATHLRGVFGGFLRQFEHAATQFAARCVELALHFGSHLLHALDGFGKALIGVAEQGLGVAGGLLVKRAHRLGRALPLFLGILAHALVLFADRARAFGARL